MVFEDSETWLDWLALPMYESLGLPDAASGTQNSPAPDSVEKRLTLFPSDPSMPTSKTDLEIMLPMADI